MKIVIPSEGRAETMTSDLFFPSAIVSVSEQGLEAYQKAGRNVFKSSGKRKSEKVNEMVALHPDESLMFFDDDIIGICFHEKPIARLRWKNRNRPDRLLDLVYQLEQCAKDIGAFLFGFNTSGNTLDYQESHVFGVSGFVSGHCFGLLPGHGLSMNPDITGKNDFWISALNACKHRICWRDNRVFVQTRKVFQNSGGLSGMRDSESEKRDIDKLKAAFGSIIQLGKSYGGTRRKSGEYSGNQRVRLRLPY